MLTYDKLQLASDFADSVEETNGEDWCSKEGLVYADMMSFCADQALFMASREPRMNMASVATGVMFGIRIANLANRFDNIEPIDALKDGI